MRRGVVIFGSVLLALFLPAIASAQRTCYVPTETCPLLLKLLDSQVRDSLEIEVQVSMRERDTQEWRETRKRHVVNLAEQRITGEVTRIDTNWKEPVDRIMWFYRNVTDDMPWPEIPTKECRCSMWGTTIDVYSDGRKVDEYPAPKEDP